MLFFCIIYFLCGIAYLFFFRPKKAWEDKVLLPEVALIRIFIWPVLLIYQFTRRKGD